MMVQQQAQRESALFYEDSAAHLADELRHLADVVGGQSFAAELISERAGDEAVANNHPAAIQRGGDNLGHHLRAGRHVE